MQQQMNEAITRALGAGIPAGAPAPEATANSSRRVLAAMVQSRETRCPCVSCQLLRTCLEEMIGNFLTEASRIEPGNDPEPASRPAAE